MSEEQKAPPRFFTTVTDMRELPAEKIDHFCEDLRLWLHMHKQVEEIQAQIGQSVRIEVTTRTDAFGWIDDNRHDANIKIDLQGLTDLVEAVNAAKP